MSECLVAVCDPKGTLLLTSAIGLAGGAVWNRFIPSERDLVRDVVLPTTVREGRWQGELHALDPDTGEAVLVLCQATLLHDGGGPERIAIATSDLRDRRRDELRDAFLVRLDDATRALTDAREITYAAARLLGEHLGVNRCAYADVEADEDTFNLTDDYNHGVPSIVGRYRFIQFGEECLRLMRADQPYVVVDAESDPRTAAVRESYRATMIRAVICVPLRKRGRFAAAMAVHLTGPRQWRADEVELVRLVAGRCWESIERGRAEAELRRQWHTFDVALAHTPDFTYIFDLEGRFTYINRALLSLWQKPLEAAVGKNFFELEYPPVLAARLQDQIKIVVDTGQTVRDHTPFTGADGQTRHYEYIFVPVLGDGGRIQAVAGSTRDITDRMRQEEELREANAKLTRINAELEQYTYVVSHDLQEPLRMVSGFVTLLEQRAREQLGAAAQGYAARAVEGVRRMQVLIRDLLAYAKLDQQAPAAAVDLEQIVAVAVDQVKDRISETGAVITCDDLPQVAGNEVRISQVFQNLIGNALKFHRPGVPPVVHVSARRADDGRWIISVRDNGLGIAPEQRLRIFDVFQRLHTATEYEGTGIGLAICKKIIEHHGGSIRAEAAEGHGTVFVFTLAGT